MNTAALLEKPAPSRSRSNRTLAEERVILHDISWETYERLLDEIGESRGTRLAYDEGTLEIMSPLGRHEHANWILGRILTVLTEEFDLAIKGMGSMTCKRKRRRKGLEPDNCFYIQNEPLVRKKELIDLESDPPPDLMIEIDMTGNSIDKFPIYEGLGVKEIWRFDGEDLLSYRLKSTGYEESDMSPSFPGLPLAQVFIRFLKKSCQSGERAMIKEFRAWVRSHIKKAR